MLSCSLCQLQFYLLKCNYSQSSPFRAGFTWVVIVLSNPSFSKSQNRASQKIKFELCWQQAGTFVENND